MQSERVQVPTRYRFELWARFHVGGGPRRDALYRKSWRGRQPHTVPAVHSGELLRRAGEREVERLEAVGERKVRGHERYESEESTE